MFFRQATVQRLIANLDCQRSILVADNSRRAASSLITSSSSSSNVVGSSAGFNNKFNHDNGASTSIQSQLLQHALSSSSSAAAPPSAPPAQQITSFPSIIIGPNHALSPQGSFAEAQAAFLEPPQDIVESLLDQCIDLKVGIVAHYYMDVELQGILHAMKRRQVDLRHAQQLAEEDGV